jgi:hypothetical protein
LTLPPARITAHMAIGYHIVFVLKSETVSPGCRPYLWTSVALRAVAFSFTCSQSKRSWVMALTYAPSGCDRGRLYSGDHSVSSNSHSHVVRCVGSVSCQCWCIGWRCDLHSRSGCGDVISTILPVILVFYTIYDTVLQAYKRPLGDVLPIRQVGEGAETPCEAGNLGFRS